MAFLELEDAYGRVTRVPVFNESEDGTGTWHVPVCDTSGFLKVAFQSVLDDVGLTFGTGGPAKIQWQTDDANAHLLAIIFPEGSDPDVPGLVIADATGEKDLGFFNGLTEPFLAIVNDAGDAYVRLDAGDDAVAGSKGLYFSPATDEDVELLNINVTNPPRLYWDMSKKVFYLQDAFLVIDSGSGGLELKTNLTHGATDLAETDTYWRCGELEAADGGALIRVLSDSGLTAGSPTLMTIISSGIAADTTKSTSGAAIIESRASEITGSGYDDVTADGNIWALLARVSGAWKTLEITDVNGDKWLNGKITVDQATTENFFAEFKSGTQSIGGFKVVKVVYDKDSALFNAAGTTDNVELLAATSGRQIIAAKIVLDVQFTLNGDRTGLIVEMGEDGGDIDDIIDNTGNLETDSVGTEYKTRGALWDTAAETTVFNRVIDLTATLSGGSSGNLASMSTGQISVYLLTLDW